ncbi:uncharacterized protein LOC143040192 [Oratosquilla oratoria]|uniref:uncharacterized protein LOC143040192 n=1 Tax=Oratosquilla oratoria TaxID=337810 RepID=UPI003F75750D
MAHHTGTFGDRIHFTRRSLKLEMVDKQPHSRLVCQSRNKEISQGSPPRILKRRLRTTDIAFREKTKVQKEKQMFVSQKKSKTTMSLRQMDRVDKQQNLSKRKIAKLSFRNRKDIILQPQELDCNTNPLEAIPSIDPQLHIKEESQYQNEEETPKDGDVVNRPFQEPASTIILPEEVEIFLQHLQENKDTTNLLWDPQHPNSSVNDRQQETSSSVDELNGNLMTELEREILRLGGTEKLLDYYLFTLLESPLTNCRLCSVPVELNIGFPIQQPPTTSIQPDVRVPFDDETAKLLEQHINDTGQPLKLSLDNGTQLVGPAGPRCDSTNQSTKTPHDKRNQSVGFFLDGMNQDCEPRYDSMNQQVETCPNDTSQTAEIYQDNMKQMDSAFKPYHGMCQSSDPAVKAKDSTRKDHNDSIPTREPIHNLPVVPLPEACDDTKYQTHCSQDNYDSAKVLTEDLCLMCRQVFFDVGLLICSQSCSACLSTFHTVCPDRRSLCSKCESVRDNPSQKTDDLKTENAEFHQSKLEDKDSNQIHHEQRDTISDDKLPKKPRKAHFIPMKSKFSKRPIASSPDHSDIQLNLQSDTKCGESTSSDSFIRKCKHRKLIKDKKVHPEQSDAQLVWSRSDSETSFSSDNVVRRLKRLESSEPLRYDLKPCDARPATLSFSEFKEPSISLGNGRRLTRFRSVKMLKSTGKRMAPDKTTGSQNLSKDLKVVPVCSLKSEPEESYGSQSEIRSFRCRRSSKHRNISSDRCSTRFVQLPDLERKDPSDSERTILKNRYLRSSKRGKSLLGDSDSEKPLDSHTRIQRSKDVNYSKHQPSKSLYRAQFLKYLSVKYHRKLRPRKTKMSLRSQDPLPKDFCDSLYTILNQVTRKRETHEVSRKPKILKRQEDEKLKRKSPNDDTRSSERETKETIKKDLPSKKRMVISMPRPKSYIKETEKVKNDQDL